ncbi:MAG: MFS transporter [Lachnospiraceae bacterium]|nr:MFS transporter [Lachnospiraceae bacterium]
MKKNYKKTLIACYLGFITQAIVANFTPLLFLKFHNDFGISLGKVALIPTAFFFVQILVDIICAKYVDRIGYRKSVVASEILAGAGLIGLAFLPSLFSNPFIGIIISVVIYATGSGLIEVLCSPIVEACPFDNKDSVMSLLHSFYCWGSVGVILLTTLFFAVFGIDNWRIISCIWALVPLVNVYNFATCPIEHLVEDGEGMSIGQLFKIPLFWVAIVLMICAGSSEITMAQWASAYVESGLGLSKSIGDLLGPCLFAVAMGISRVIYGKSEGKFELTKYMLESGALCVVCYLLATLFENPVIGLIGCIVCGFSVGIMWPGTISITSSRFPSGGTAMFALLAMAGDMGGTLGPSLVGNISQKMGDDLHKGLLYGTAFPVILVISVLIMKASAKKEQR